jgi:hypothetical protein
LFRLKVIGQCVGGTVSENDCRAAKWFGGSHVEAWQEAEAQLYGGVERESQMHPGSSLFKYEH